MDELDPVLGAEEEMEELEDEELEDGEEEGLEESSDDLAL